MSVFPKRSECVLLLVGLMLCPALLAAAEPDETDETRLSVQRIFGTSEFGAQGYSARWVSGSGHDDGSMYERMEASGGGRDLVRYEVSTGNKHVIVSADDFTPDDRSSPLSVNSYAWSHDESLLLIFTNAKRVWRTATKGDYWVLDRSSHELTRLGGDAPSQSLMFATLSPSGRQVAYVRDNDIYVEDLRNRSIRRLTERSSPRVINGTFDWVYEEELFLRNGFRWSPDGRRIAFWQLDTSGVREVTLINNTEGLYPTITKIPYPKAGETNSACRLFVVDVETGHLTRMQVQGDERNHYIARMEWAENSDELVLQQLDRLQQTNRVMIAQAATGDVATTLTETDPDWVDVHDEMRWLDDGRSFTWISERDGWRHLYVASRDGGQPRLITPGDYDVIQLLTIDEPRGFTYFIASPDNPTQRYLYRVPLEGGEAARLTPDDPPGTHSYDISPDARWAIHSWSSFNDPPRTELIRLPSHESVRMLEDNEKLRNKLEKVELGPTEFFRVDIGEGVELNAWCILPTGVKSNQRDRYPLLVYVYGEPAGQTVLDRWNGSGHLWHQMLAQQGYVVMSFDNRGTPAPRGREWRKCVYRQVGILAPQDQAAAVKAVLKVRPYLDPARVGVWGWSGGGSMTLNAMLKFPDLYKTGISIAPVPNQRYYDTIYQERYMGLPSDNVDGYLNGSSINFADQLAGNLLVVHGTADDNVHYQGTEALVNRLIRHNKPFTLMAYPNRSHSISEGKNTSRHLRELMTRYLHDNLPAGPAR